MHQSGTTLNNDPERISGSVVGGVNRLTPNQLNTEPIDRYWIISMIAIGNYDVMPSRT